MARTNVRRREKQEGRDQTKKSKTGTEGKAEKGIAKAAKKTAALLAPEQFNPVSKYEEQVVVPGLTLFDIERKPRASEKKTCTQPLNSLNTLFQCPVCRGYMKKTFIVMECLHRFCGSCIQKCLRVGKKECPSCRVHIPSRRSLRPDLNYDALIEKIFGDVEYLEEMEDKSIETWNRKNNMNNAYTARREIGISFQAKLRKLKGKSLENESSFNTSMDLDDATLPSNSFPGADDNPNGSAITVTGIRGVSNETSNATNIENLEESKLVNFIFRPHPSEKSMARLHRECMRTSELITMGHLKRFLGKKLCFEEQIPYIQILTGAGGRYVVIDDEIKLREVRNEIADRQDGVMLKLHYRCRISPSTIGLESNTCYQCPDS